MKNKQIHKKPEQNTGSLIYTIRHVYTCQYWTLSSVVFRSSVFSAVKLLSEQFRNLTRIQKFAKIHKMKHKKKHKNLVRNADSLRISNTNVYTY